MSMAFDFDQNFLCHVNKLINRIHSFLPVFISGLAILNLYSLLMRAFDILLYFETEANVK